MVEMRHPVYLLPSLLLLIPLNIYLLGGGIGTGIQWGLFRYQVTAGGESLVSLSQDLSLVSAGLITGNNAVAYLLWALAVLLLIGYFIVTVSAVLMEKPGIFRNNSLLLPVCGSLFLIADLVQYGMLLNSPGGLCIPVGIPLFFILGIWGYYTQHGSDTGSVPALPVPVKTIRGKTAERPKGLWSRLTLYAEPAVLCELSTLVLIAIIVRFTAFFSGLLPNIPLNVILGDTNLYYWYATSLTWGQIPYSSYYVPYPQFFFIPLLIALVPVLIIKSYLVFIFTWSVLMILADMAVLVLVYSIAGRLWGKDRAFLCGLLYATAISAAFFIPITYDVVPSFLLLLSLWMYLYRNELAGFLMATVGALTKWYPAIAFPYYLLHGIKTGKQWRDFARPLLLSGVLVLITLVPFLLINTGEFLKTYTIHAGRMPEVNSAIYYLDAVSTFLIHAELFRSLSLLLMIAGELALLYWYYRHLDSGPQALIGCIFLAIFTFILANKVFSTNYIIWLVPFLSLLLAKTPRRILLFYAVQVILYLETPVLFGIIYAPFNEGYDAVTSYTVLTGSLPSLPFLFYTIKFGLLALVFWIIVCDLNDGSATTAQGTTHPP
ncbi:hypothetical protein [Methanoregula sp.]|uniref:hypothetical protein n=1 Tax=Methanoregula sp. TaxID=2052170 RepID=UPI002370CF94|nr:hypothetical protein [Methanoregula sp.]MDD1687214.1 hypothetical protein [Methanoregula sp.]